MKRRKEKSTFFILEPFKVLNKLYILHLSNHKLLYWLLTWSQPSCRGRESAIGQFVFSVLVHCKSQGVCTWPLGLLNTIIAILDLTRLHTITHHPSGVRLTFTFGRPVCTFVVRVDTQETCKCLEQRRGKTSKLVWQRQEGMKYLSFFNLDPYIAVKELYRGFTQES